MIHLLLLSTFQCFAAGEASDLPACSKAADAFAGVWEFSGETDIHSAQYCPKSWEAGLTWSTKQYGCAGSVPGLLHQFAYPIAEFIPTECTIHPASDTLPIVIGQCFARRQPEILWVGDSLTNQLLTAFRCELERAGVGIVTPFVQDFWLTTRLPCSWKCENTSFLHENRASQAMECYACHNDTGLPNSHYSELVGWRRRLTNKTCALVIGAGAWYTPAKLGERADVSVEWARTLAELTNVLSELKIPVFWLGLPPCQGGRAEHHWNELWRLDLAAKNTFSGTNVQFLDTSLFSRSRKEANSTISADGLHWCNPGRSTIPKLMIDRLLHLLQVQLSLH